MRASRDVWWHDVVDGAPVRHEVETFDSEHPLFSLYTSGTTGKPKGILHTTGGYLTGTTYTTKMVFDLRDGSGHGCGHGIGRFEDFAQKIPRRSVARRELEQAAQQCRGVGASAIGEGELRLAHELVRIGCRCERPERSVTILVALAAAARTGGGARGGGKHESRRAYERGTERISHAACSTSSRVRVKRAMVE